MAEQQSRLLFEKDKEAEHVAFINGLKLQLRRATDANHLILSQAKTETHILDVQRDTTAQHSMHNRTLATKLQQTAHELAHLET